MSFLTEAVTRWSRWFANAPRPRLFLATLVGTATFSACSPHDVVSTTEPVTGPGTVYALATANELSLPATFQLEEAIIEIRKGALTLGTDSTFIFSIALRAALNGGQPNNSTTTFRGTLKRSGDVLALVQTADTMFVGTYSPNAVSLSAVSADVAIERYVFVR